MKSILLTVFVLLSVLFSGQTDEGKLPQPQYEIAADEVNVPVLLFHDVKTEPGGTWSMSAENLKKTFEFLLEKGYTPITLEALADYAEGRADIPAKPVCITFDDGYYSNYKKVLPIITEFNIPITVFMTCGTVRDEGEPVSDNEQILSKMSLSELTKMEESPLVSLQSHSYALHGMNTSYGRERDNILPLENESKEEYREALETDISLAEQILKKAGSENVFVFSYPSGKWHSWSEEILHDNGYKITLTSEYGHQNTVRRGQPETLYMLGRMNVNDETTEEMLLSYLERE